MTRGELRVAILDRLTIHTTDTSRVTQINTRLNLAYLRLVRRFRLKVETADLVFAGDDPVLDLPDDFMEVLSLRRDNTVLGQVSRVRMAELTAGRFDVADNTAPGYYAFEAPTRLRVEPPPGDDDETGAELVYVAKPPSQNVDGAYGLASDFDTPDLLPEEYHEILVEMVVEPIAMSDEQPQLAGYARQMADSLLMDLQNAVYMRPGRSVSHTKPQGYWAR